MYRIGEFSSKTNLSVRTLRYYDQENVLKPGYVDYYSGYRYYTDDNIEEAKLVELLKSIDFSLEEIVTYKDNLTTEVLINKKEEILNKINELTKKVEVIDLINEELENEDVKTLKRVA